jgi:putative two-component system response regulator
VRDAIAHAIQVNIVLNHSHRKPGMSRVRGTAPVTAKPGLHKPVGRLWQGAFGHQLIDTSEKGSISMMMGLAGTILVVDDDESCRKHLAQLVGSLGYAVTTARDGDEALSRISDTALDLVIVDARLPDIEGRALTRKLRTQAATADLPIILTTDRPDLARGALSSGADAVLHKPLKAEELLSWVRCLVRARQADVESERLERVLFSIAASVEARSLYLEDHLWHVAAFGEALAQAAGLRADEVKTIRRAALVHDIGMISVPDVILRQPRSLTPAERSQINPHTVLGGSLTRALAGGREISAIVRGHHERWIGGGYPDGLTGEQIPIGARIVSIADAFDAMTSTRPYRASMSVTQALDILWNGADEHWDRRLIELFAPIVRARESGAHAGTPPRAVGAPVDTNEMFASLIRPR